MVVNWMFRQSNRRENSHSNFGCVRAKLNPEKGQVYWSFSILCFSFVWFPLLTKNGELGTYPFDHSLRVREKSINKAKGNSTLLNLYFSRTLLTSINNAD